MSYNGFAYWYDDLNYEADYEPIYHYISHTLEKHGLKNEIVADLGCGTGEICLRLAQNGYDMIGVDASADMLSMVQQKKEALKLTNNPFLLCQPLQELDLYGSIGAAISTFDTFNHLKHSDLEKTFERLSLFIEPHGLLIFDMNTPYKHTHILKNNTFTIETKDGYCEWTNKLNITEKKTEIHLKFFENNCFCFEENFYEYIYEPATLKKQLEKNHFTVLHLLDGDTFEALTPTSQRFLMVAEKR